MKKLAIGAFALVILATGAFAGQPIVTSKEYKPIIPQPCFREIELQLDIFGSYTDGRQHGYGDGWGGGFALNYFFTRYFGVGAEGNVYDGNVNGVWNYGGRFIARYPIDSACLAPYGFVAGGGQSDGHTSGTVGVGGGLEYRVIADKLGIFGEGRYTWSDNDNDSAQVRFGLRVVF
jgi:hypothetical protein